jgi:phage terminase large subunit
MNRIYLPGIVGKGYKNFWHFTGRYRVVKGGRGSKKSKTTALNIITRMLQYPGANTLVVRKVYRTLKDSCFAELRWAVRRLRCEKYWSFKESPLEMTYRPTGQKIFFRGLDDAHKIASLAPDCGSLCWMWVEEAFEVTEEKDFNFLDECIRGNGGIFKQITLTFNPWNERHWLNRRFFAQKRRDTLAMTATYRKNEFLDASDRKLFAAMKKRDPRRYRVAGLGEWGVSEGLIYENWREEAFDSGQLIVGSGQLAGVFGLDFGYATDPAALFCGLWDKEKQRLYVFDELYEKRLTNQSLFLRIEEMGFRKEKIAADAAEPKSIEELRQLGLSNIRAARKGPDSIRSGIRALQGVEMIVHPRCVNFLTEISTYIWGGTTAGESTDTRPRPAGADHLMDAMRYAMEGVAAGDVFSF